MHVIATTSQKNADFVKALGANEIIEYDVESFEEAVERGYFASESEKVDLVIDPLGYKYENFTIKKAVLKNLCKANLSIHYRKCIQRKSNM